MSLSGSKKSRSNAVVPTPAISSIALNASYFYITKPFASLYSAYTAVSSAVTKIVSTANDTFRGKKRNAEAALQVAPPAEEEARFEADLAAIIAAAEANRDVANAATNLASVPSPTSSATKGHQTTEKPRHIQLSALDSIEGQRLYEGRKAMRAAGKRSEFKRTDGEEPLKRFFARRGKAASNK